MKNNIILFSVWAKPYRYTWETFLFQMSRTFPAAVLNVEQPPWGSLANPCCHGTETPTCSAPSAQRTTCENVSHTSVRSVTYMYLWCSYWSCEYAAIQGVSVNQCTKIMCTCFTKQIWYGGLFSGVVCAFPLHSLYSIWIWRFVYHQTSLLTEKTARKQSAADVILQILYLPLLLLLQEVSSLGLPPVWAEQGGCSELNVVAVLNCMYDLIQLHRRGLQTLENMEVEQLKSSSNVEYLQLTSTRLKVTSIQWFIYRKFQTKLKSP